MNGDTNKVVPKHPVKNVDENEKNLKVYLNSTV